MSSLGAKALVHWPLNTTTAGERLFGTMRPQTTPSGQ
jgi:hypothetical protein